MASLLWMVAELSGREQVAAATPCEQAKPCVDVNWIEVTQAIQDTNNLVPLIAGKRTLVRAYFIPAKGHGPVNLATGELFAKGPAGKTKTFLSMPSNVPATATGDGSPGTGLQSSRHDLARSLNFELPINDFEAEGLWTFSIVPTSLRDTNGKPVTCDPCNRTPQFRFQAPLHMKVFMIGIKYHGINFHDNNGILHTNQNTTHQPTPSDYESAKSWLKRAYPISTDEGIVTRIPQFVDTKYITKYGAFSWGGVNAQLEMFRKIDIHSAGRTDFTRYYGLVYYKPEAPSIEATITWDGHAEKALVARNGSFYMRGASPFLGRVGSGITGPSEDGAYTGHELGHSYGRRHASNPPKDTEEHKDQQALYVDAGYPYPSCQISKNGTQVGVDLGERGDRPKALPGLKWHDVMSYCKNYWISDYTYKGIMKQLQREEPKQPQLVSMVSHYTSGDFIAMTGSANLTTHRGHILFVKQLKGRETTSTETNGRRTPVWIRMFDRGGRKIGDAPANFLPNPERARGEGETGVVEWVYEKRPDMKRIELWVKGHLADTYEAPDVAAYWRDSRSSNIDVATPDPSNNGKLRLNWDSVQSSTVAVPSSRGQRSFQRSAATASYDVEVRRGRSDVWETIQIGLSEPTLDIDLSDFGDDRPVEVRVNATVGFETKEVARQAIPPGN